MILVALLTGSAEDAGAHARLAAALGVTLYEARLALAAGFPAIVLTTADRARASAVASALRAQGDDVVSCDAEDIVSSESMVPLDRFTLDPRDSIANEGALPYRSTQDTAGIVAGQSSLPYDDIVCLLRAIHRARIATETRTTERRFSAGKSLLSGGLANTKVVSKTTTESADSREPVLYIFRRSGATPWILREVGTHYEGLGAARGLTTVENFATTVRLLRERAPAAAYDERLVRVQRAPERAAMHGTGARSTVTTSSAPGIDALAHLLALSFRRG